MRQTQEVPTPLLLGFYLVALTIAAGVAIAPRRMLKILSLGLGQRAARQVSSRHLSVVRALAVSVAAGIVVMLITWAVTGIAP
jgi:hypothetical protein